jgi:protein-S-isoprenylcysteine O-methyltransferase Ste14
MTGKLVIRFALGLGALGALLWIAAGSLRFWQGWAWFVLTVVTNVGLTVYLARTSPALLERRMQRKESSKRQTVLHGLMMLFWVATLVVGGLDFRRGWSRGFPAWLVILALATSLATQWIFIAVFRANRFAAATIRVEAEQTVISTGPYGVVRHPMYTGLALMAILTPLALASWVALACTALALLVLVLRLLDEERVLRRDLPGYAEYCRQVQWRLIPDLF